MTQTPPEIPKELEKAIFEHLKDGRAVQEHTLLKALTQAGFEGFKPTLDELALFRCHFLCFHVLYRLQAKWQNEGHGWLEVYTLNIQLHTHRPPHEKALTLHDSLRDYYLNYQHFVDTQATDVQALLDDFWAQFSTQGAASNDDIHNALTTLELETLPLEDIHLNLVNQQYRKLSAIHHPDKGGKTQDFQALSAAANLLRKHYQSS